MINHALVQFAQLAVQLVVVAILIVGIMHLTYRDPPAHTDMVSAARAVEAGAPETELIKAGPKACHDAAHQIGEMLDRFQQRFTLANPRFVDRYLKAELHLLVRFRIGFGRVQYIARFERSLTGGLDEYRRDKGAPLSKHGIISERVFPMDSHFGTNVHASEIGYNRQNQAVLVDVVQSVQGPEIMPLASVVWFGIADRVNRILPHALYFSSEFGFEFLGIPCDQKGGFVPVTAAVGPHEIELLGQVVEGPSQVADSVAGAQGDIGGRKIDASYVIHQLSGIRIAMNSDFVWLCRKKGFDLELQFDDVLVGPVNFVPYKC